ncbi:glycosyltransferase [Salinimicrobium sp. CDJ15-81-2]|nr:glycosyltransferase [Salinimicrobium nanhaiense]
MKVIIYASTDVFYYSFYIKGLSDVFGKKSVKFSVKDFPAFPDRTFAVVIKDGQEEKKIIIDAFDSPRLSKIAMEWCDVYGKVNYHKQRVSGCNQKKVIPIGPGFGIKIWNIFETVSKAFSNYQLARKQLNDKRNFFANYWRQFRRLPLYEYCKTHKVKKNYVFFISSIWQKEKETNMYRSQFIEACLELKKVNFEGGFAPRSDGLTFGYETIVTKRINLEEYIESLRKSVIVFNTPAVEKCHGWKLGEYLAMGKAILSTEHINELPSPLVHKKHIHYVQPDKTQIKEQIVTLISNEEYCNKLEENARSYFRKYLEPQAVIQNILSH